MPGRKLNFERVFDETWLGFLRSEHGLWDLFVQTGVRATYISSTYLLFQESTSDDSIWSPSQRLNLHPGAIPSSSFSCYNTLVFLQPSSA